jgi:hypothetical protein
VVVTKGFTQFVAFQFSTSRLPSLIIQKSKCKYPLARVTLFCFLPNKYQTGKEESLVGGKSPASLEVWRSAKSFAFLIQSLGHTQGIAILNQVFLQNRNFGLFRHVCYYMCTNIFILSGVFEVCLFFIDVISFDSSDRSC